jgi:hypothetical protein
MSKTSAGNVTQINYLVRAKAERLGLIEGDGETFGDVLGMIDDYEGMFRGAWSRDQGLGESLPGVRTRDYVLVDFL